jgi:competence protein ComEC
VVNFKSIPFFKILFPYVAGIISALYFNLFQNIHVTFLIAFIALMSAFLFHYFYKKAVYFKKALYIVTINIFLFVLAYESCFLYNAKNNSNHYSHFITSQAQRFTAVVEDIPVTNEKFTKLKVKINCIESDKEWHYAEGTTIIYLKNKLLQPSIGNTLLINSKFGYLTEPKNPEEFNYKQFLEERNIFYTVFVNDQSAHLIANTQAFDITQLGVKIKSHLVSVLRNSQLSQPAFSICSALLVGYDDEVDSDIMQSFSHSGTLHILSVSGMHTGVLYAALVFIFSLFDKYDEYKKIKLVFILFFLMMFVFITGLSPSVLRAALMLSLVLLGKTFYKEGNSYNTLLFSAFLLLLFNPYLIKDVGFLLSYCAVFGIMYLYPILNKLYVFENKYLQKAWSGVLLSVSATLFTLPISLYYFHQFPIWFVFSNLIIIPISMLIMVAAALFLVIYKITFLNNVLVFIINSATSIMLWLAKLTDNPKYGFVDFITFHKIDLLLFTVVIGISLIIIASKQYKYVLALCFVLISWIFASIYRSYEDAGKKEFIVFHVKQKSAAALRIGHHIYISYNNLNNSEFQRYIKPYLLSISDLKITQTTADLVKHNATSVLFHNKANTNSTLLNPNYVVISNDVPFDLTTNYKTKPVIIADCSNSYKFVNKLRKQCKALHILFYSIKEKGAYYISL